MRKYTNSELAQLYDKKDWAALWKIMTPMIKHAVRRCMREGFDPHFVREDLMQEAYLAAWKALPSWNAFEGGLMRWLEENVCGAILKANAREASGMVGGRDAHVVVVSMHGDTPEADHVGSNDEQELSDSIEASLAYEDPPEGLWDPADERLYGEQDLAAIPPKYRDMVRRLAGIGVPQETQAGYAVLEGIRQQSVADRVKTLQRALLKKAKVGN
jgi:DNA-directed RNA polymerase specialized sigma24 family protein